MVTGIEFSWVNEDTVRVKWDPVTNENILGYKVSWSGQQIEHPTAAITATDKSEFDVMLMENEVKLYIYIWTYNFVADGPRTNTCK